MISRLTLLLVLSSVSEFALGQTITNGLQLYYNFDGSAVDQTTNGFDGTINGPVAVQDEALNPNSAYFFDGVNDFIDLPADPLLKPQFPFSYSLKVKFETLQQNLTNMFTTDYEEDNYNGSWCELGSGLTGKINLSIGGGLGGTGSGNRRTKSSEATVVTQKWYRLTFVVNGVNDMDIYIDCVNAGGAYTGGASQLAYSNVPGSVGRKDGDANGPSNYFNGTIDDLAFWNRALTQGEIVSLCDGILGVEESTSVSDNSITIYPNPASQDFVVEFDNTKNHDCLVELVDLQGRVAFSETVVAAKITVDTYTANLNSGLYLCRIYDLTAANPIGARQVIID